MENYFDPQMLQAMLGAAIIAGTAVFYLFCRFLGPK